ncbi:MAG: GDSL-type esterase/lipase family protein [candidate division KSB1 bacterium]|nr:GDSL-type esterase/lipase family protein [candidate division KSB1 bacterium]
MKQNISPYSKSICGSLEFFKIFIIFCLVFLTFGFISCSFAQSIDSVKWVGTWTTSPQLVEQRNNPPSPGLSHNTLRQVVHVSIGGDSLQMRFSNEFSASPVTLKSVHLAVSAGGSAIDTSTNQALTFGGAPEVTMEPGAAVTSDPFRFALQPLSNVTITIFFGETSPDVTGHPGSRTTSYILTGNHVSEPDFEGSVETDHWYVINTLDVLAPDTSYAVAILGNSITDGRGSGTNKQNRWPDELARRLQENPATEHVAVLNAGIGGNAVLRGGLGPTALSRFQRDVINQNGIKWVIIFEGINDIGGSQGADVGHELIEAYQQMIYQAHANGIFAYGATLLPMKDSFYYSEAHEAARQSVNEWIRNSGAFDAVIDLDKALRNPADTLRLKPEADTGDHLHPNETGHRMMAEAVDLALFTGDDTVSFTDKSRSWYFEPECGNVGEEWEIVQDDQASNGTYVTAQAGMESLDQAPDRDTSTLSISFSVDSTDTFSVYARVYCPTFDDDSFWVRMNSAAFQMYNGLVTNGWEWKKTGDYSLTAGQHILTIAYREDGARLDKLCISNSALAPTGMGRDAENLCNPTGVDGSLKNPAGYQLGQNYPNPFNPTTHIEFELPEQSDVKLVLYDVTGRTVATLADGPFSADYHTVTFDASNLATGIYFYKLKTNDFTHVKKLMLIK